MKNMQVHFCYIKNRWMDLYGFEDSSLLTIIHLHSQLLGPLVCAMGDEPIQKGISSFQDADFASAEAERLGLALTMCLVPFSCIHFLSNPESQR